MGMNPGFGPLGTHQQTLLEGTPEHSHPQSSVNWLVDDYGVPLKGGNEPRPENEPTGAQGMRIGMNLGSA